MDQHQNIPELRFEGFTEPWEQRKLGDIAVKRVDKNVSCGVRETFTNSAEQGIVSQLDFFDHGITNDENIDGYYVVEPDDFVYNPRISTTAPCGPINRNRLGRTGVMSPLYTVFAVHGSVDRIYLEHYFKTSRWHRYMFLEGNSGARSDRFSISDRAFFEMPIFCPNEDEQSAIALFFEALDSLITLQQRKCERLRHLKQALLRKMFPQPGELVPELRFEGFTEPWEQRKLGELYEKAGSGGTPSATNPDYYNGDIPFLGISDIDGRDITFTKKSITEEGLNNSAAWIVPAGAIALAMYASVGKVGIIRHDTATSQAFFNMVFLDESLRDFVYTRLEKAEMDSEWDPLISTGTQSNLNAAKVSGFEISVPSREERRSIANFFIQLDSLISLQQRKCERLRYLKQALLRKMFV